MRIENISDMKFRANRVIRLLDIIHQNSDDEWIQYSTGIDLLCELQNLYDKVEKEIDVPLGEKRRPKQP